MDKRVTAVVALIWGKFPVDGYILSVSRKNDPHDLGLPGGKVEHGETPYEAVVREVTEEGGPEILDARVIFERHDGPHLVQTFLVTQWKGEIGRTTESGRVKWVKPREFLSEKCRSFREYNAALFRHLDLEV